MARFARKVKDESGAPVAPSDPREPGAETKGQHNPQPRTPDAGKVDEAQPFHSDPTPTEAPAPRSLKEMGVSPGARPTFQQLRENAKFHRAQGTQVKNEEIENLRRAIVGRHPLRVPVTAAK
jgi:hypothetical protein